MPLDPFALAPIQRQTVPNTVGTTNSPYAQEQAATNFLADQRTRGAGTQARIGDFYTDPTRMTELSAVPQAQAELGFANLGEAVRQRSLQEAFGRARAGLGGGSVHAEQLTQMDNDAARAGTQIANTFQVQQDQLRRAFQARYLQDLLGTLQLPSSGNAAVQARLSGVTADADRVAAEARIRAAREADEEFANDELSRVVGGVIDTGTDAYRAYQGHAAYSGTR